MEFEKKEYSSPDDLAEAMINSGGITRSINLKILNDAPFANHLTPTEFEKIKNKIASASLIYLKVKSEISRITREIIPSSFLTTEEIVLNSTDPKNTSYAVLYTIESLLKKPEDEIAKIGFPDRKSFRIALLQEGINLTKKIHNKTDDQTLKKDLFSFTVYYSALQVLLVGAKTHSLLLNTDPDNFMKIEDSNIGIAVFAVDENGHEKTKIKSIFDGFTILEDKKSENGSSYLIMDSRDHEDTI